MPKQIPYLSFFSLTMPMASIIFFNSCLEYHTLTKSANSPPFIDKTHVKPAPAEMLNQKIKLGKNCKKEFSIPPIKDPNTQDTLYYLWFIKRPGELYGKLLQPRAGIIPLENRDTGVISLSIDLQTIETALGYVLDDSFYSQSYLIEFYVSDRQYLIPDNRYTDSNANEDYLYWTVTFANEDC
ncbi:MAG: hypothetical protein O2897_03965 [bacterium]|nr:hypothetical protein [bacterium]